MTLDRGADFERTQGITPIEGESLSLAAEHYFQQSEQIPTKVRLAVGSVVTVVSTYANIWFEVPWSDSHNQGLGVSHHVFNDYIAQGLAMSVFTALGLVIAIDAREKSIRWAWVLVAAFTVFSITHLLQGRTGQVVLLAMFCALASVASPAAWRGRALRWASAWASAPGTR